MCTSTIDTAAERDYGVFLMFEVTIRPAYINTTPIDLYFLVKFCAPYFLLLSRPKPARLKILLTDMFDLEELYQVGEF